jgi:hypothetical protein
MSATGAMMQRRCFVHGANVLHRRQQSPTFLWARAVRVIILLFRRVENGLVIASAIRGHPVKGLSLADHVRQLSLGGLSLQRG